MTSSTHDQKWTYTSLRQALAQRDILLRVHTSPTSPLPKGNNDSDPSTSGFTARNAAFKGLSPAQFKVATARLRMEEGWAEGPYMRKVIIDHINNTTTVRSRVTPPRFARPFGQGRLAHVQRRDPIPARFERFEADEQSPWISTTEKLDWAIWYISKLLSQGHKTVHLAIIRNGARNGEISVMPFRNRLGLNQGRDPLLAGLEGAEREAYRRARSNSIVSNEILLYGRIFGESILADMTFTSHVVATVICQLMVQELPFGLPLHFWNPIEHIDRSRQGWLARLRYHPMLLNFGMAMENINRPPAPRGSWSMQPVNHELQVHASALKSGPPISTLTLADRPVESAGVPQNQKLKNEAKVEERDEEESEDGSEIGEDEDEDEDEVNLVLEGLLVDLTIPDHLKK